MGAKKRAQGLHWGVGFTCSFCHWRPPRVTAIFPCRELLQRDWLLGIYRDADFSFISTLRGPRNGVTQASKSPQLWFKHKFPQNRG